jgi:hypothetical protein
MGPSNLPGNMRAQDIEHEVDEPLDEEAVLVELARDEDEREAWDMWNDGERFDGQE